MCDIAKYIEGLKSEDWRERHYALEQLEKINSVKAFKSVIKSLTDPEPSVRWRSASLLGKIGNKLAVPYLVGLLKDRNGEVRLNAVRVLGDLRDIRSVFPLTEMLYDDYIMFSDLGMHGDARDSSVKGAAAYALQKIGDTGALPALKKALSCETNHTLTVIFEDAIESLTIMRDPEIEELYIKSPQPDREGRDVSMEKSIEPSEKDLDKNAAPPRISLPPKSHQKRDIQDDKISLSPKFKPREADLDAGTAVDEEEKSEIDGEIIESRREKEDIAGKEDDIDTLPTVYETPDLPTERSGFDTARLSGKLLEALVINEGEEDVVEKEEFLPDEQEQEEEVPPELEAEIKECLSKFESDSMFTRLDAVQTLEKIGRPAVKFLVNALEDQNWRIREGAAETLLAISDITTLPAMKKALPIEPEDSIKKYLEKAIQQLELEKEVKECIEKLQDNNIFTQLDAVKTLENIGEPAVSYLLDALNSDNWKIREGVVEVLSIIGDFTVIEALEEALKVEEDKYVKKIIKKAIKKLEKEQ